MSNIGSFFNLGSQTTLVNENKARLRLKINPSQQENVSGVNFVFPANEGDASGYVLATDGSGTTSWVAQSGGGSTNPGGDANAIQFKGDDSDFSGVSNLTFDSTSNVLVVDGDVSTNTLRVASTSTLGGQLTVNAQSNLSDVDISSTLDVSGATNLNTLDVSSVASIRGNLIVSAKSDLSNVTVSSTLDVSGATTLDKELNVNALSNLNSLNVSGVTTLDGQLTVNADSSLNNVSISKGTDASNATLTLDNSSSLVMSPQIYEDINDFSGINIQPVSSILIFDYSNNQEVDCSLNNPLKTYFQQGQHLSIFYLNRNATGNLRIDFGDNNIVTGSGANRYLTFTTFGQSAELLAYGNSSNTNNYLVFNSGADASS